MMSAVSSEGGSNVANDDRIEGAWEWLGGGYKETMTRRSSG
jgi:hypothetical protein